MLNLDVKGNRIIVTFPYSDETVKRLRDIGGGRFCKEGFIHWRFPLTKVKELTREFPDAWQAKGFAEYLAMVRRADELRALKDAPQPIGIKRELRPFQRVAHQFLNGLDRCILNGGVGIGKSICGICWTLGRQELDGRRGILVVTKAVGKYAYQTEILEAMPRARVCVIEGEKGPFPRPGDVDFVVLNYDLLYPRLKQIKDFGFAAVIFSEVHKLKGGSASLRGKVGLELGKQIPAIFMETASLIPNRNAELFPLLCILGYLDAEDYFNWHLHFCGTTERLADGSIVNHKARKITINRRGTQRWDFSGSSCSDELHQFIAPFTFSITKAEALPDLPLVTFTPMVVEIDNRDDYNEASRHFLDWVREQKGDEAVSRAKKAVAIVKLGTLSQLATAGKVADACDLLETYVEAREKVIVFSSYKMPLYAIRKNKQFAEYCVAITGDESPAEKERAIQKFQTDPNALICLCTTEAAGESATLTASHTVLFLSLPWSPKQFEQAWGRSSRYGQKSPVEVIVLIGRRTQDVERVEVLYGKEIDTSRVISGTDHSENSEALKNILRVASGEEEPVEVGEFDLRP